MLFLIKKTSAYDNKPCTEARKYKKKWMIEIITLDQLISLCKKYGNLIIKENSQYDCMEIEIYDDYRE